MLKNNLNVIIIAVAVVISSYLFSNAFQNRNKSNDTISVTGSGKKDFVSDLIVWSGSFSKKSMTLKEAYAALDSDREKIKSYLSSKGIAPKEMVFSAVNFNKDFETTYNENGTTRQQIFTGFNLTQSVSIQSKEVNKIKAEQARSLYRIGKISYSEAISSIKPYIDEVNIKSKELAKKYNQRPRLVQISSFMR